MSAALPTGSEETFPPLMIPTVVRGVWHKDFAPTTLRIVERALLNAGPIQHLDSLIASPTGFAKNSDSFVKPVAGDVEGLPGPAEVVWAVAAAGSGD